MERRYKQPLNSRNQYPNPWNDEDYRSESGANYNYYDPRSRAELERQKQREIEEAEEREAWERERQKQAEEIRRREEAKRKENMSSWLQRAASSTQAQFAATALVSGAVVAGAIFGYQAAKRQERVEDLKGSIPEVGSGHVIDKVS
jgi:hypothetical protein